MGRQRRNTQLDDSASWIFNRMAEVYDARPAYPAELVNALGELRPAGARVLDLGAGTGHLALPLAQRGFDVVAIEPAEAMLEQLRHHAEQSGVAVRSFHAAAELLPLDVDGIDLAIVADALHFIDAELAAAQLRRVLVPGGHLAIITCEFAETPYMTALRAVVDQVADRRPRRVEQAIRHLAALADVRLTLTKQFHDATPVDIPTLERILRSVSFVGPALSPERYATMRERLLQLAEPPVWARKFTLQVGKKRRRSSSSIRSSG